MWPEIPVRTKVRMFPYLVLLAIGLLVADNMGIIDLAGLAAASPTAPTHRTHRRVTTKPAPPSPVARADIPPRYLALYREAGGGERWGGIAAWAVLAGIGKVESDHGRSSAPGVRSGVNSFGCCAGPMQFNLRNGPPSTWDTYGRGSPYDPADAIPAAVRLLHANGARRDLDAALLAYNHSGAYVADVKALARRYQDRRS